MKCRRLEIPLISTARTLVLSMLFLGAAGFCSPLVQAGRAESSETHDDLSSPVRVLFYGQSITAGGWTPLLEKELVRRFPSTRFEFANHAIGGYQSPVLIRTAEHDLYPWYPDILFFHVYGDMDAYEDILRQVRERNTTKIVIWSSHFKAVDDPNVFDAEDDLRAEAIRKVADRIGARYIDLRAAWRKHLIDHAMSPADLLKDGVIHLNQQGNKLYARIIGESLDPHLFRPARRPQEGDVRIVPFTSTLVTRSDDGTIRLPFTGNRVVAVSHGRNGAGGTFQIRLDGGDPASFPGCWAVSRPSKGPAGIWMPAINRVGRETLPLAESWTLTCLPDSAPDGSRIQFELAGSVTGPDGSGWSDRRFVSSSGRVVLEPRDWHIARALKFRKATLPEDFTITWDAYPLFTPVYAAPSGPARTVLVQGCPAGEHVLTLAPVKPGPSGISHFIIHCPTPDQARMISRSNDRPSK